MQVSIYARKSQTLAKNNTPDIPSISLSHFTLQFPQRHLHRSQPMIFLQFWPLEMYLYMRNEMRDRKHRTHINHSYRFTLLTRVILQDFLLFWFFLWPSLYCNTQENNIYNLLLMAERKGRRRERVKISTTSTGRQERKKTRERKRETES